MKTLVKLGLGSLIVAAVLLAAPPKQAQAHRYYSYYGPTYGPVYRGAYYPRRAVYRAYYPRRVYYAPTIYAPPVYYGGYYGGCGYGY